MRGFLLSLAAAAALSGCATAYQSSGLTGGFRERHIAEDVYRITFAANGFSTRETAQTYWLYRITEITLEKGFDGFEVLSPISLGQSTTQSLKVPTAYVYVPIYSNDSHKPIFEADVRLLKGPITADPPKVFDARSLKASLEPYVKGEKKCDSGNVCPHIKDYLRPSKPERPAVGRDA